MEQEERRVRAAAAPAVASDRPYVDWGAILAGGTVAVGISAVFTAFGAAVGLGSISARPGEGLGFGSVILTGLFLVVSMVLAYMAGGYIAGRMRRRVDGASPEESAARDGIHGLVVWALGTIVGAFMLASAVTGTLNAAGSVAATAVEATGAAVGGLAQGAGTAAAAATDDAVPGLASPLDYATDGLLRSEAAAPGEFSDEAIRREVGNILTNVVRTGELAAEDRTYLEAAIAARTTLTEPEVAARIDQAVARVQQLRSDAAARVEELRREAIETAEAARRAGVLSAFALAASALVAAAAAFIGAQHGGRARDEGRIWGGLTHRPLRRR